MYYPASWRSTPLCPRRLCNCESSASLSSGYHRFRPATPRPVDKFPVVCFRNTILVQRSILRRRKIRPQLRGRPNQPGQASTAVELSAVQCPVFRLHIFLTMVSRFFDAKLSVVSPSLERSRQSIYLADGWTWKCFLFHFRKC